MHGKTRGLFIGLIAALSLLTTGCSSGFNDAPDSSGSSMETVANPTGVTAAKPMNAAQADRMTLPVRDDGPVKSWADLNKAHKHDPTYVNCLEQTLGVNWDVDIPRFIDIENKRPNGGVTIIVANNVKRTNDLEKDRKWVRDFAEREDKEVDANTPVVFTSGFKNTRDGDCVPFIDKRSIIRVAEAVPTGLNEAGKPYIGPDDEVKGVLDRCNNPFTVPFTPSSPSPSNSSSSPSASSSPSPSGSTSSPPSGTPTPSLETKIPSEDPAQNGNSGNGGGKNEDPGPGEYKPPSEVNQPPDNPREDPPAPEADKPAAPTITSTPRPAGSATPTVDPGGQDNDGVVDPDDCAIC